MAANARPSHPPTTDHAAMASMTSFVDEAPAPVTLAPPPSTFVPSPQQADVFRWVDEGRGNAFVEAVAGSGKTTTLIHACRRMRGNVAFAAYNKKIADEIKAKLEPFGRPELRAGTFHSFGLSALRRAYDKVQVDDRLKRDCMTDDLRVPDNLRSTVIKMVSIAKQSAVYIDWHPTDLDTWHDLIDHYDLAVDLDVDEGPSLMDRAIGYAQRAIEWSIERASALVDFDDMIWIPLVENLRMFQNAWVLVDEAQDTNPARRHLASRMLQPDGRMVWVGDRHQAIYGFCHPAGVPVMTPSGWRPVEDLRVGDLVIAFNTTGDMSGGNRVTQVHRYTSYGSMLTVHAAARSVDLTPHHRLPVKVAAEPCYFTYIMRRGSVYRAGYCASHTTAGPGERRFMLSQRCKMEGADCAWILAAHATKFDAIIAEAQVHKRGVTGQTFAPLDDEQVAQVESDPVVAEAILVEHGRMVDFPLWKRDTRHHFELNVPFITEACNIVDGWRVQVFGDRDERKRGFSRHTGKWHPCRVESTPSDGEPTYGITIDPIAAREGYANPPLYAAGVGGGIIVHNTGATANAVDVIIRKFRCLQLPLTVTYRCPKSVVDLARRWVSHIEAHESAPVGVVRSVDRDAFLDKDAPALVPGDAILCRLTRPLVSLAFSLIRRGIGCHVEGRDIGQGLMKLATRWKVRSVAALEKNLEAYRTREIARLEKKGSNGYGADAINDRCDTLRVIMEGCADVAEVVAKIDRMFKDTPSGQRSTVTLSTVHKAKGREWPRVYILGFSRYMPSKRATQNWQKEQESNLIYVGVTRAQRELVLTAALED